MGLRRMGQKPRKTSVDSFGTPTGPPQPNTRPDEGFLPMAGSAEHRRWFLEQNPHLAPKPAPDATNQERADYFQRMSPEERKAAFALLEARGKPRTDLEALWRCCLDVRV